MRTSKHLAAPISITTRATRDGERAADLVYDTQAARQRSASYSDEDGREGVWVYPACYDDFRLARRRAHSLSLGFGIPFAVDLFGAGGPYGDLTASAGISEPGYYAFTTHDPRPRVVRIGSLGFLGSLSEPQSDEAQPNEEDA
ncbi:MAG TPA: hypothetical protein VIC27_05025 [Ktedonobacterales bacterium]